jgi:geranylgeranyl diphosphate synthase type II
MLLHALRTASEDERQQALEVLSLARPSATADADASVLERLASQLRAGGHLDETGHEQLLRLARDSRRVKTLDQVRWLQQLIDQQGSLDYARGVARRWADRAARDLEGLSTWLPPSRHRQVLEAVVDYVHRRTR